MLDLPIPQSPAEPFALSSTESDRLDALENLSRPAGAALRTNLSLWGIYLAAASLFATALAAIWHFAG